MNTYRVLFTKEKTEVTVKEGTTVLEAERIAGLSPDAPCGGAGKCGKCMVKINGAVEKACQTKITTDIEVEAIEKKSEHRILVKGTERAVTFSPELEILDIEIPPCTGKQFRLDKALRGDKQLPEERHHFSAKTGNTACNQPTDKRKKWKSKSDCQREPDPGSERTGRQTGTDGSF